MLQCVAQLVWSYTSLLKPEGGIKDSLTLAMERLENTQQKLYLC